ncbi:hypothetical protein [Burkholderia ubonensis]|uniref:hypothetical protein n=1 Tax=Burkholderia ubonensis TaxID=101571 RepID=UPI001E4BBC34|nr:hypothetical protein [Burkholderia ubonensis]
MYYSRHRYYDPGSEWFISNDSIGLAGGINVLGHDRLRYLGRCRCVRGVRGNIVDANSMGLALNLRNRGRYVVGTR